MLIDLQTHSTYSDGYLTPTELAYYLKDQGVKVAALTDHNTIRGQGEFHRTCRKLNIKTVPGLELYVKLNNKRFNILWYNFKDTPDLHEVLRSSQVRRKNNVRRMLDRLASQGFILDKEKILDQFNHYVPINHIIDDILKVKHNKKVIGEKFKNKNPREDEIIKEYFYNKKDHILHESYINIERVLRIRKKIGGEIIINHPGKYQRILNRQFFEKMKKIGVDGIEVASPHHSIGAILYSQHLAREFNFIETGGSDFHRFEGQNYPIQHAWQYYKIDSKYLKGVEKIIG